MDILYAEKILRENKLQAPIVQYLSLSIFAPNLKKHFAFL